VAQLLSLASVAVIATLGNALDFEADMQPALASAGLEAVIAEPIVSSGRTYTSVWVPTTNGHIWESLARLDLADPETAKKILRFTRRIAHVYAASSTADRAVLVRLGHALADDADRIDPMLESGAAYALDDVSGNGGEMPSGGKSRVTINKAEIARMMRDIQCEFDRHQIRVPINADTPNLPAAGTTNVYNGPVFHGDANGAQLAWNNAMANQTQNQVEQITPGYEALALAVTKTLERIADVGLTEDDRVEAESVATEILHEVTQPEPSPGRIRRGLAALKGFLMPIAYGAQAGAAEEARELARTAIDHLGSAF